VASIELVIVFLLHRPSVPPLALSMAYMFANVIQAAVCHW